MSPTLLLRQRTPMASSNAVFLIIQISFIIFLLFTRIISADVFSYSDCLGGPYPPNGIYQSNLNRVLNALSSDTQITYGFYNFSSGQGQDPDKVSSLAICRGDVPLGTCRQCIKNAAQSLPTVCNQVEAFGYTDYCTIFVSNRSIYGTVQDSMSFHLVEQGSAPDASRINRSIQGFLSTLVNKAASGNAELKYAVGTANLTTPAGDDSGKKLYGLAQCTPDLDKSSCINCLQDSLSILPSCCLMPNFTAPGLKFSKPSCFVRYSYDVSPFYGNVPNIAPPPPSPLDPPLTVGGTRPAGPRSKKSSNASKIAIPIPIAGASVLIIAAAIWRLQQRKKQRKSRMRLTQDEIDKLESLQFSYAVIKHATEDFKGENKLGQGGFGTVYKGVLSNGHEIAVKRLSRSSGKEGDVQFKNEILILAKLQHKNLMKLLGFCLHEEELLLIYELVPNRSLDKFLFDPIRCASMLWETRYRIINGIARGLLYLHEGSRLPIIHRDLKAENILLDEKFNPKIADFGMAKLFNIDQTQTVTSNIVGTYGYMPPEYVLYGQVSVKSDVFSFGVLVLEIISGQKISSFMNEENPEDLLSYAWRNWKEGTSWNLVDVTLSTGSSSEILRCIHISLLCVQENLVDRPTMSSITLMLSNCTSVLPVPSPPAYHVDRNNTTSNDPRLQGNTFRNRSLERSVNEVSITQLYPR